jgi:hypothetical protein
VLALNNFRAEQDFVDGFYDNPNLDGMVSDLDETLHPENTTIPVGLRITRMSPHCRR